MFFFHGTSSSERGCKLPSVDFLPFLSYKDEDTENERDQEDSNWKSYDQRSNVVLTTKFALEISGPLIKNFLHFTAESQRKNLSVNLHSPMESCVLSIEPTTRKAVQSIFRFDHCQVV